MDIFHWSIFGLHLTGAMIITFGVWFRCDPDVWVSRMRVDTYQLPLNSTGLWWGVDEELASECSAMVWNSSVGSTVAREQSMHCFREDMPLYESETQILGWHLFSLLGHFEWISASFAFFYIKGPWNDHSWWISTAMTVIGTVCYCPWRGTVFVNEVLLLMVNLVICVCVFYGYRKVHGASGSQVTPEPATHTPPPSSSTPSTPRSNASSSTPSTPRSSASGTVSGMERGFTQLAAVRFPIDRYNAMRVPPTMLGGQGSMETSSLILAELPAMRYMEYCITAAELWVAVLAVFVIDPPAFMTIGGYTLILLCNLYGALLHYSLVSDNMTMTLTGHLIPDQIFMQRGRGRLSTADSRRRRRILMNIPEDWLGATPAGAASPRQESSTSAVEGGGLSYAQVQHHVWGSFIASNMSTLLNSWLAYAVAIGLVFYQQTFLFSPDPPFFVVFAGWSLLVFYTSFGVWITVIYYFPGLALSVCPCCPNVLVPRETYELATLGLDILSVGAKLSIVGSLAYGFVFQADGRC